MIIFVHWHASSFPSETFGGRMQYAPTPVRTNFWNFDVIGISFLCLFFYSLLSGRVGAYRIRPPDAAGGGE